MEIRNSTSKMISTHNAMQWGLEGGEGCLSRQGGSLLIGFFHQISGNTLSTERIVILLFISFVSDISAKPVL